MEMVGCECLPVCGCISFLWSFKQQLKIFFPASTFLFSIPSSICNSFQEVFCWPSQYFTSFFHTFIFFFFWYRRWDFVQSTGLCAEGLTYIPSVSHVSYPLTYLLAYKYRNTSLLQKKTIMVILVYKPWKWREKQGLCALTHILN